MKFVLLPDEYLPNGTRIHAKMFHELAHELQRLGHKVVIITPGEPNQAARLIEEVYDDIEVWRFRTSSIRGVSKIRRALNESLLSINAWIAVRHKVKLEPFDVCINYSPTIFFGPLTRKFKTHGTFVYLILRDMFPQWVIDQGMIKDGSVIARYFRFFERLNYQVSDCIGVMSEANLKLFHKLHPGYPNVSVLMNWSDTTPLQRTLVKRNWIKVWGLDCKIVFFYGGNIGHAQDMANLLRLAKNMLPEPKAHFLFIGQGDEVDLIHQLKNDWRLDNVTIKPAVSQEIYREILTQVNVGLFSLSPKHTAHNFPGKLLGYMSESLPILGSVNKGNDVIDLVNNYNAGQVFENGQDQDLVNAAKSLLHSKSLRQEYGTNSRRLLEDYFSVESIAKQILREVNSK